jgi:hypothetical protein
VDLNDVETRKEMGKPYPEGEFICAECDYEIYDKVNLWDQNQRDKQQSKNIISPSL